MNVETLIEGWKEDPCFVRNVGMVLSHYGMVRGTSRNSGRIVQEIIVEDVQNSVSAS